MNSTLSLLLEKTISRAEYLKRVTKAEYLKNMGFRFNPVKFAWVIKFTNGDSGHVSQTLIENTSIEIIDDNIGKIVFPSTLP